MQHFGYHSQSLVSKASLEPFPYYTCEIAESGFGALYLRCTSSNELNCERFNRESVSTSTSSFTSPASDVNVTTLVQKFSYFREVPILGSGVDIYCEGRWRSSHGTFNPYSTRVSVPRRIWVCAVQYSNGYSS